MKRFLILLLLTVPATADDLARSVEMMAKVGAAYAPSFSPDAERLAYITNISGSPQVWIVPSAGGYPQQVTAFNDPVTGMSWSPDGTRVVFTRAVMAAIDDEYQYVDVIHDIAANGTGLRQISSATSSDRGPSVSPDGRYGVLSREGASDRVNGVVILDLATPAHPKVAARFSQELTGGVHNTFIDGDLVYASADRLYVATSRWVGSPAVTTSSSRMRPVLSRQAST